MLIHTACPQGIDIFFDNVGGVISDAVIPQMNVHGRIVLCGQIALYNMKQIPPGPRIQPFLLTRSLRMEGFIVSNYANEFPEGIQDLKAWMQEGKLKSTQTVVEGFSQLPKALIGLFSGKNTGKMIVHANH